MNKQFLKTWWLEILGTIVVILVLILTFVFPLFASELTLEETKDMLGGDPHKIVKWMTQNIKTAQENIGYAQSAERMFKWRKGDCEDWAILSRYFIGNKYETYLIVWCGKFREDSKYYKKMKNRKISHCILAIKLAKNHWGIIDQDKFISHGKSLVEIIKINCDLRKVELIEAFIAKKMYKFQREYEKIDLNE